MSSHVPLGGQGPFVKAAGYADFCHAHLHCRGDEVFEVKMKEDTEPAMPAKIMQEPRGISNYIAVGIALVDLLPREGIGRVLQGHEDNVSGCEPSFGQGNLDVEAELADGRAVQAGNAQHPFHNLGPVAEKTVAGGDDDQFRARVGAPVSRPDLLSIMNKPHGQRLFNQKCKDQKIDEDGTDASQDYVSQGFHG